MLQERRRHTRHIITPRLYVGLNNSSSGGILNDVSEGGMALDILGPKPANADLLLDLDLSEIGERFEVQGRITWSKAAENRVGLQFVNLTATSQQSIKKWLANKAVAAEAAQNVLVQDWARDGAPLQYPVRQVENISRPVAALASAVAEGKPPSNSTTPATSEGKSPNGRNSLAPTEVKLIRGGTPVPGSIKKPARLAAGSPTPRVEKPEAKIPEPQIGAATAEAGDRLVSGLRSSFSQAEAGAVRPAAAKTTPKHAGNERETLRNWIVAAVVIFLMILAVAGARWVYTSPAFDKVASTSDIREMVAGVFNPAGASAKNTAREESAGTTNSSKTKTGHARSAVKSPGADPARRNDAIANPKNAAAKDFQVMDAQNGRRVLPRITDTVAASEKTPAADTTRISGGQPASGSLMQEKGGAKVGMVSVHPTEQVPETKVLPEYPAAALQNNVQGRVVLKAMIGKDGTLQNVRLAGPPSILSGPVLEAVKKWRYQPRTENGVAVEVETQITIDFEINAR